MEAPWRTHRIPVGDECQCGVWPCVCPLAQQRLKQLLRQWKYCGNHLEAEQLQRSGPSPPLLSPVATAAATSAAAGMLLPLPSPLLLLPLALAAASTAAAPWVRSSSRVLRWMLPQ